MKLFRFVCLAGVVALLTIVLNIVLNIVWPGFSLPSLSSPPPVARQAIDSSCDRYINRSSRNCPNLEPEFQEVGTYTSTIASNGDKTDIYYPISSQPEEESFPIALLLQGFNVNKSYYSQFATEVARYGFVVVVPNHFTSARTGGRGRPELFAQVNQVTEVLADLKREPNNANSPIANLLDTQKMVLIGHSHGGFMGMDAIRGACDMPFCEGTYRRPTELKAGVFFAADFWEDGEYLKINNSGIAVGLIAGSRDSLISIPSITKTYRNIQTPPKVYITVMGANHYGINDLDNPPGSPRERNRPTLNQELAVETIARWTALFLRAHAFDDRAAWDYIYDYGRFEDRGVRVISQD